jgi:hypothetical protein
MKLVFALLVAVAVAVTYQDFQLWKATYNKDYSGANGDEEAYRYKVWSANMEEIHQHNAEGSSWTMRPNQFTDLTHDEFRRIHLSGRRRSSVYDELTPYVAPDDINVTLTNIDWVANGAVTGVRDQGNCGSCWAFATAGAIESFRKLQGGPLEFLSTQQIVDCDKNDGGCNGGLEKTAMDGFAHNTGLCTDSSYPYKGYDQSCKSCSPVIKIGGGKTVTGESNMASALLTRPLTLGIDGYAVQSYGGGVMTACRCDEINHAVLLVGLVTKNGQQAWKVKNSWSSSWGEGGYFYLPYGKGCICMGQDGTQPY